MIKCLNIDYKFVGLDLVAGNHRRWEGGLHVNCAKHLHGPDVPPTILLELLIGWARQLPIDFFFFFNTLGRERQRGVFAFSILDKFGYYPKNLYSLQKIDLILCIDALLVKWVILVLCDKPSNNKLFIM